MIGALDVGGSSIKFGVVDRHSEVHSLGQTEINATGPDHEIVSVLGKAAKHVLHADVNLDQLAVAFPDPFDYRQGIPRLYGLGKFDSIYGLDLRDALRPHVGADTVITFCHDAEAAAVGEAICGAGQSHCSLLMITIGTGMGAAFVRDGRPADTMIPVRHLYKTPVDQNSIADDTFSARGLAVQLGIQPEDLPSATAAPALQLRFDKFGRSLGEFLRSIEVELQPDAIVIGGGGAGAFHRFGPAVARQVSTPVVKAKLGQAAALIGAASMHPRTAR